MSQKPSGLANVTVDVEEVLFYKGYHIILYKDSYMYIDKACYATCFYNSQQCVDMAIKYIDSNYDIKDIEDRIEKAENSLEKQQNALKELKIEYAQKLASLDQLKIRKV